MNTYLSFLSVITGGFAAVIIGFVWYSPYLFGKWWLASIRLTPQDAMLTKTKKYTYATLGVCAVFVLSLAIYILGVWIHPTSLLTIIEIGFVVWGGFIVPPLVSLVIWEQKKPASFFINAGYWLVTSIVVSLLVMIR